MEMENQIYIQEEFKHIKFGGMRGTIPFRIFDLSVSHIRKQK
jgi:hypothetical protein